MIFEKRVLWFKTIRYALEPWPDLEKLKKNYAAIYLVSYEKKDLPGFSVKIKETPIIYLNRKIEEVFNSFNETTRNEIRRTFDDKIPGLKIIADDQNLDANYQLSKKFEYQQGRVPEKISMYRGCRLFSAYLDGEIISSIICYDNNQILRAKAICSKRLTVEDRETYKIISYATRRLIYEACQWGIKNNYQCFDLGSVNFAKENLAQFKLSFTKDLVTEYTYTYKSQWFELLASGVFIKKILKKLLKL
ncbi:MAG TPA: hypothetical protein VJG65_02050 [Patescibacteria group bacterium]|nr:hypothetical protein [Patescibacteria group bacterium]